MNTVYNVYHFTAIGMHVKGPVWPKAIFQLDVDLGRLNPPMASLGITIFVVSIPLSSWLCLITSSHLLYCIPSSVINQIKDPIVMETAKGRVKNSGSKILLYIRDKIP